MFRLEPTPEQKAFAKYFESLPTYTLEELEALTTTENKAISAEPEPEPEPLPLMLNDGNFAKAIEARHGENIRYVHDVKKPFLWKRTHWQPDTTDGIFSIPRQMIEEYEKHHRAGVIDEKTASIISRTVKEFSRLERQAMVLKQLYTFPYIGTTSDCFDNDPHKLNTLGGTYTFRFDEPDYYDFKPHSRNDMITHCAPVKEGKSNQCKTWISFLDTVFAGDLEMISFIKRFCGYLLEGGNKEQLFFIFKGVGGNGKGTFLRLLAKIFGTYHASLNKNSVTEKINEGIRNDLAPLAGKRLAVVPDTGDNPFRLDTVLVKTFSGGDTIRARYLYHEEFDLLPQFTFIISTNPRPIFNGADEGMRRRLIMIPFDVKPKRENNFEKSLEGELNDIFAWMLEGYKEYREQGLTPPQKVLFATDGLCSENDPVGEFLTEHCDRSPNEYTLYKDFKEAFNTEQMENGGKEWNKARITTALKAKGFTPRPSTKAKNATVIEGISLKREKDLF